MATLLIVAGVVKASQFFSGGALPPQGLLPEWLVAAGVPIELGLGLWLIVMGSKFPLSTWAAATAYMAILAVTAAAHGMTGKPCPCLGGASASPWLMFAIDAAVVAALLFTWPEREGVSVTRWLWGHAPMALGALAGVGLLASLFVFSPLTRWGYSMIGYAVLPDRFSADVVTDPAAGADVTFICQNITKAPVSVLGADVSCGWKVITDTPFKIPAGGSCNIVLHVSKAPTARFERARLFLDTESAPIVFSARVNAQ